MSPVNLPKNPSDDQILLICEGLVTGGKTLLISYNYLESLNFTHERVRYMDESLLLVDKAFLVDDNFTDLLAWAPMYVPDPPDPHSPPMDRYARVTSTLF